MKLLQGAMNISKRIIWTATFPLQVVRHPINTASQGLTTIKNVSRTLCSKFAITIPLIDYIAPSNNAPSESNLVNPVATAENHGCIIEKYEASMLQTLYNCITSPLSNIIFSNNEENPGSRNIVFIFFSLVLNLLNQVVAFVFAPETQTFEARTQERIISDRLAPDNNEHTDYDNEYNHKSEYLRKLTRERRKHKVKLPKPDIQATSSTSGNTVEYRRELRQLHVSEYRHPNNDNNKGATTVPMSAEDAKVCDVCGFESQNPDVDINQRIDFESERVQYKSQIETLLKRIDNLQHESDGDSASGVSMSGQN